MQTKHVLVSHAYAYTRTIVVSNVSFTHVLFYTVLLHPPDGSWQSLGYWIWTENQTVPWWFFIFYDTTRTSSCEESNVLSVKYVSLHSRNVFNSINTFLSLIAIMNIVFFVFVVLVVLLLALFCRTVWLQTNAWSRWFLMESKNHFKRCCIFESSIFVKEHVRLVKIQYDDIHHGKEYLIAFFS
jgi:hypothetical protein